MGEVSRPFTDDHRRCDDAFIAVEQAVSSGDWAAAESAGTRFIADMEHHFAVEEEALFPALKSATAGAADGPIQVMRMEHEQMRGLLAQLKNAIAKKDARVCLDLTETLLMIMQQHNMKEENILYPMADRSLGAQGGELERQLRRG